MNLWSTLETMSIVEMPTWREQFSCALHERDIHEKTTEIIYNQYSKLADRSILQQENCLRCTGAIHSAAGIRRRKRGSGETKDPIGTSDNDLQMLVDLSEAQHSRRALQMQLQNTSQELRKVRLKGHHDAGRVTELEREKASIGINLSDRNEELKVKSKMLEDLHDEIVSLTLELNMADAKSKRLEGENKELIERWMRRMVQEADCLNKESNFS